MCPVERYASTVTVDGRAVGVQHVSSTMPCCDTPVRLNRFGTYLRECSVCGRTLLFAINPNDTVTWVVGPLHPGVVKR